MLEIFYRYDIDTDEYTFWLGDPNTASQEVRTCDSHLEGIAAVEGNRRSPLYAIFGISDDIALNIEQIY